AAHEQGLVHRDVKPANVLIARQRGTEAGAHAYLTDFGLTKRAASDSGVTETGQFVGTLDYAAPEQFRGQVADARTDVYSLACVLFECLAGHPPFRAENEAALMFAHLMEAPPRLTTDRPNLPDEVDEVVATAMAKAPDDRYPSAGTFASRASAALGFPVDDRPAPGPAYARRSRRSPSRRRRRVAIGAIATVLAVVLIAALLTVLTGGTAKASFPPGISIVDQVTGEALRSIPTSAIRQPAEAIYSNGRFWVHNLDPNSFVEVDPRDGSVLTQIPAPFQDVGAFTVDGDTLWVTGPSVVKIDIGFRGEVDRFDLPYPTHGVVVAEGSLWVTMPSANTTLRLDPGTGELEHRFPDLPGSLSLAYGDGAVWTAGWISEFGGFTGGGGVNRIDPDTDRVTMTTPLVLSVDCCPVVAGGGFGWTTDQTKGVVYKIDPSGQVVASQPTGAGASIGSYSDGVVWVGNSDVGTVVGIDALTGERRTFSFEHPLQGLAAGSGVLLVTLGPGRTYEDVIGGLEGHVARLFAQLGRLEIPDPAVLTTQLGYSVEFATCAKLLNYPDAPSPEGWNLRPEVAAAMPDISSDGRTYTFEIRPGYRFSPPSNEPITAETFRYSIERAIGIPPPPFDAAPRYLINDIEGESEFLRGDADHISGLRAEGDTLTIELREPSADFLHRLSYPFFCPVPTDSPLVAGGAGAFVGYPHRTPQAVPSAGPYYIADHLNGEYTILKRNPNYSGPRPHAFDAIALREGIDPGVAVGLVERGSWDGITHVFDPLLTPTGPVAEKYGGEGTSEGSLWYDAVPWPLLGYLIFNASRPTFSDPDVRRAAALALDRESVAALWGHAPTDQLLPPVTSGFVDRELYPLDGSGLDEARSLMDGRRATAVFGVESGNDRARQEAEIVRDDLSAIGITVEIEEFPDVDGAAWERGADIDIIGSGFEFGSWDPASFLINVLKYGTPHSWLPKGVLDELGELLPLTGSERRTTALALADRLATGDVPIAADLSGVTPTLLAPSIGCRVVPPFAYGVDLAALCPSQA
ncbi:MAG: ABC transporter substrate-binding protein, partial [Actinomycetota bacterium]